MQLMNGNLLQRKGGILLDIGAGDHRRKGFVTLDKRPLEGIDIVHDLEVFPYPLEDESCLTIVGSHIVEHIKPWLMLDFMDELWRLLTVDGKLALSMPYGIGREFVQDPTHCNPCNEATWQYFDPRFDRLYTIYKPKPWEIEDGFPQYQVTGNLEIVMRKIYETTESEERTT